MAVLGPRASGCIVTYSWTLVSPLSSGPSGRVLHWRLVPADSEMIPFALAFVGSDPNLRGRG